MRAVTASAVCNVLASLCVLLIVAPCEARLTRDELGARIGTRRLAAGAEGNHTCFVRADGNVLCWGDNASGQIGDGTSGNVRRQPTPTGVTTAVGVAVGKDHSCALLATGVVHCWGSNASGQLGVGSGTAASSVPVTVPGLTGVVSISAGTAFTCARKSDGTVRCWGTNQFGQLGDDTTTSPRFTPVQVTNLTDAVKIVAGATHACALRGTGAMACWGGNGQGQLGTGNTTNRDVPTAVVDVTEFTEMAAGLRYTCAAHAGGDMFCWGDNDLAQLGTGATSDSSTRPVEASVLFSAAADVIAGESHTCAIGTSGTVQCWGANGSGQLGRGFTSVFESIAVGVGNRGLEAAAGRRHTCLLATNDVVRCWGDNTQGQLGNTSSDPSFEPTGVLGLSGSVSARRLAAGTNHSCAVRADGAAACWGRSEGGAIGDGAGTDALVPSAVSSASLCGFQSFVSIAAGGDHNCALVHASAGCRVGFFPACWGDNRDGQGDPFDSPLAIRSTPQYTGTGSSDFEGGMSAGSFHTCGLSHFDNKAACWGNNDAMQLGSADPNLVFNDDVGELTSVIAVAAGGAHSCALRANGHVFCWGGNDFGQLGDGTRNDSATPREVGGIATAVAISTTRDHNCALLASGAVVCWGRNDFGQVDGTLSGDRLVATPVASIASGGAVAVTTGFQHSCILTAGGRVRCWGRNNSGQLGNNTLNNSLAPVEVLRASKVPTVLSGVIGLVSVAEHNCALLTTGQPFCWGRNPEGQLGDGTRTRRLTAVGIGSFAANIARTATFAASARIAEVTALVNCPEGERFSGTITITQASSSARRTFSGACTGGLSEYPFAVPVQGRDAFAAGDAVADLEIVVHKHGDVTDEQQWTRRIVLVQSAP